MSISVFQMFKIGIGPSSSHTVGPMKAAKQFLLNAKKKGIFDGNLIKNVRVDLYGSLALTGRGHATDKAIIMGLLGEDPETVETPKIYDDLEELNSIKKIKLLNEVQIDYNFQEMIVFNRSKRLKYHTNGMKFTLLDQNDQPVFTDTFYSVGGGFIINECDTVLKTESKDLNSIPFNFDTGEQLFEICTKTKKTIPEIIMENEKVWLPESQINEKLDRIWAVMNAGIERGLVAKGYLPGPLRVERRAWILYEKLKNIDNYSTFDYLNYINMNAIAASEENSCGGQIVTAPTNGSAGIIPAVIKYYNQFYNKEEDPQKIRDFLLTASAIGQLYKKNATISGAEGGCQAEIGVSCSMAAGGLSSVLGGSINQIEKAAEIAMEHFIGLTCDPIGGLVQIPCIERNAIGAVKAVNSAALALNDDIKNKITLDRIIRVMKRTGDDMKTKYKETSEGGLAEEYEKDFEEGMKTLNEKLKKEKKADDQNLSLHNSFC